MSALEATSASDSPGVRQLPKSADGTWWHNSRTFSHSELVGDGVVHALGLLIAVTFGAPLVIYGLIRLPFFEGLTLAAYVASMLAVLGISMAFNLVPVSPLKRRLARFDQAMIFVFVAATYTPLLTRSTDASTSEGTMRMVWAAACVGAVLKLAAPRRFARSALALYLGISWSAAVILQSPEAGLAPEVINLLLWGGLAYTAGIVFHVWQGLRFHNVLWHCFVIAGMSLHMSAIWLYSGASIPLPA